MPFAFMSEMRSCRVRRARRAVFANTPKAMSRPLSLFGVYRDLDLPSARFETYWNCNAPGRNLAHLSVVAWTKNSPRSGASSAIFTSCNANFGRRCAVVKKKYVNDLRTTRFCAGQTELDGRVQIED